MSFAIEIEFSQFMYKWLSEGDEKNTSYYSLKKVGKYFVVSLTHLGLLCLRPIAFVVDLIVAIGAALIAASICEKSILSIAAFCLLSMTVGTVISIVMNVLSVTGPCLAAPLNETLADIVFK